jgi:hypothetical protein
MVMLSCRYHKLSAGNWTREERVPERIDPQATTKFLLMLRAVHVLSID